MSKKKIIDKDGLVYLDDLLIGEYHFDGNYQSYGYSVNEEKKLNCIQWFRQNGIVPIGKLFSMKFVLLYKEQNKLVLINIRKTTQINILLHGAEEIVHQRIVKGWYIIYNGLLINRNDLKNGELKKLNDFVINLRNKYGENYEDFN